MNSLEVLHSLMKKAYDRGFADGNDLDSGCQPDRHGDFDDFWYELGGGNITTTLAAMLDAVAGPLPVLHPGIQVSFQEGDFAVTTISRDFDGDQTHVELLDYPSWERAHKVKEEW